MIKKHRALTLIELLVAIGLVTFVLIALSGTYLFVYRHFHDTISRQNIYLQVSYALENIKAHCVSASKIDDNSLLRAGVTNSRDDFLFRGEKDFNTVTPDDPSDESWYHYYIDPVKNLVLSVDDGGKIQTEILVEGQYNPTIQFQYIQGTEPNFLMVHISAGTGEAAMTSSEGIRFWFIGAVK
ncbi:MAG: type II secretion system protein [bacterium]|nr:type II secretion system protein [bacterium]